MIQFDSLYILFLLPLPWILRYIFSPSAKWEALPVPFFHFMETAQTKHLLHVDSTKFPFFFILSWIFLILSLTQPVWVGEPQISSQKNHNIMMVLDISGSMQLNDMRLNHRAVKRIDIVKNAAQHFINMRDNDNIGLILFGTKAYVQTPLTPDKQTLSERIDDASVGLAGNTTSIGDALGLAVKRLQRVPKKNRIIILLTDGASNTGVLTPLKAAEIAKSEHCRVYTIGLGQSESDQINNQIFPISQDGTLDEATLKKIAAITGGQYFRATDSRSLDNIYKNINALETTKDKTTPFYPKKLLYPWFAAISLFFLLLGIKYLLLPNQRVQRDES